MALSKVVKYLSSLGGVSLRLIRSLRDDFPSLKERIALRLVPPTEDSYFTNLLKVI